MLGKKKKPVFAKKAITPPTEEELEKMKIPEIKDQLPNREFLDENDEEEIEEEVQPEMTTIPYKSRYPPVQPQRKPQPAPVQEQQEKDNEAFAVVYGALRDIGKLGSEIAVLSNNITMLSNKLEEYIRKKEMEGEQ